MKSIVGWYTRNKNVPGPPFIYYSQNENFGSNNFLHILQTETNRNAIKFMPELLLMFQAQKILKA